MSTLFAGPAFLERLTCQQENSGGVVQLWPGCDGVASRVLSTPWEVAGSACETCVAAGWYVRYQLTSVPGVAEGQAWRHSEAYQMMSTRTACALTAVSEHGDARGDG